MGYIDTDGIYHSETVNVPNLMPKKTSTWKHASHDQQRLDHQADLVQPYNRDGSFNLDFFALYPEESINSYGFTPPSHNQDKE